MILYRKVLLKVVLNRIVNLPDSEYLPDIRYPAGYPVDPDIQYSPKQTCSLFIDPDIQALGFKGLPNM